MPRTLPLLVATLTLAFSSLCHAASAPSYQESVASIQASMPGIGSDIRRESYAYITFDQCRLGYRVSGFYPTGTPYTKTFSNIDLASLDTARSKTGSDSSDYLILYFATPFELVDGSTKRSSTVIVIDAASGDQAQALFSNFLRLGEACRQTAADAKTVATRPTGQP